MSQGQFFAEIPTGPTPNPQATNPEHARVNRAVRNQAEMVIRDLDSLVAEDHPAMMIWHFLERLDLGAFYASIKSVVSSPGRPATDPKVLLALWVYATVDGVGSARKIERL